MHIPLIKTSIPAKANLLFLDYLSFVRLNIGNLHAYLEEEFGLDSSDESDYDVINDSSKGYYNEVIHSCGYHVSLVRNLLLIFILTCVVIYVWLNLALINCICNKHNKKREAYWNNVVIRFMYEVFFEVALCLMLEFAVVDMSKAKL